MRGGRGSGGFRAETDRGRSSYGRVGRGGGPGRGRARGGAGEFGYAF